MILELENIHAMEVQDRYLRELERTKKQKDMPDALERILWWQKQGVLVNMVGN